MTSWPFSAGDVWRTGAWPKIAAQMEGHGAACLGHGGSAARNDVSRYRSLLQWALLECSDDRISQSSISNVYSVHPSARLLVYSSATLLAASRWRLSGGIEGPGRRWLVLEELEDASRASLHRKETACAGIPHWVVCAFHAVIGRSAGHDRSPTTAHGGFEKSNWDVSAHSIRPCSQKPDRRA
jgi:hypothetical protein